MTSTSPFDPLKNAAKYVRAFRNKPFVIKIGGDIVGDAMLRAGVCGQLALLGSFGIPLVVVHGGGSAIEALCHRLALPAKKVGGRRVTSLEVLEASKMALKGMCQMELLATMQAAGLDAVGLSGQDCGLLLSRRRQPVDIDGETVDFGYVGDIETADSQLLRHLIAGGYVPVVAPFTADLSHQILNTNADTVASIIAVALGVQKLFFVVNAPGLLADPEDARTLLPLVDLAKVAELEAAGAIKDGMRPKVDAARVALGEGVESVHIVSGMLPDAILAEVFTNEGSGTMLVAHAPAESKS